MMQTTSNDYRAEACDLSDSGLDVGMNSAHQQSTTIILHVVELQLTDVNLHTHTRVHRQSIPLP